MWLFGVLWISRVLGPLKGLRAPLEGFGVDTRRVQGLILMRIAAVSVKVRCAFNP